MRILGIDPGLNVTGYGVIDADGRRFTLVDAGFIRTDRRQKLPQRLAQIHAGLAKVLDAHRPQTLVLEKLYSHSRHPVTSSLLGHARGVICMLAEQKNIPFVEYPATRVKKATTGHGHASKAQVQRMIEHTLGAPAGNFGPADTTDAISLAVTHAYMLGAKADR